MADTTRDAAQDSPTGAAGETAIWKIRTALRATFYIWVLAIVLAVLLGLVGGPLAAVPVVLALVWTGWRWLTSYELTSERLIIRTGFLVRKREEVELFRVRDFSLSRPLHWLVLGLGTIGLTTRDQSAPNILIGPIAMPETRLDELRRATVARQNRVRFREVEVSSAGDETHGGDHGGHGGGALPG
ncbi:PH domain-containing protein [Inquilinus limosus]|uniref:PH domain-containing protein n=1 Tax=Inquilinus limosus TaxID=171674 RepID=UPI001269EB2C|nr:PH domain-containing protein [Inquilinus limosus]